MTTGQRDFWYTVYMLVEGGEKPLKSNDKMSRRGNF